MTIDEYRQKRRKYLRKCKINRQKGYIRPWVESANKLVRLRKSFHK